jgi:hypothetical protein
MEVEALITSAWTQPEAVVQSSPPWGLTADQARCSEESITMKEFLGYTIVVFVLIASLLTPELFAIASSLATSTR